jgi:cell division septum initiation protein DivIVA
MSSEYQFSGRHPFALQLERLEDLILAGMSVPLTSWTVVNGDELVPLLDSLRVALPQELLKAQEQVEQRDLMIKATEARAQQIIDEAHHQANQLVQESEIMKAINQEADRVRGQIMQELETLYRKTQAEADHMKRQAFEEARTIVEGAEAYAANLLVKLDDNLSDCQQIVRNGHRALQAKRSDAGQPSRAAATSPIANRTSAGRGMASSQKANPNATKIYLQDLLRQTTDNNPQQTR